MHWLRGKASKARPIRRNAENGIDKKAFYRLRSHGCDRIASNRDLTILIDKRWVEEVEVERQAERLRS